MNVSQSELKNSCQDVTFSADFFEHNDVQLIQSLMFKLAKVLVKLH